MKNLTYTLVFISILSCETKKTEENLIETKRPDKIEDITVEKKYTDKAEETESKVTELIIGERIDGPANVRDEPNGDILFELYDNALIEATAKPENGWYQVLVYADIDYNEFKMDSILEGRPIIVDNETVGKVLKSQYVSTGRGGDFAYAMLRGYTHKNNIKPETVIETNFKQNLAEKGRDIADWKRFIEAFKLDEGAFGYEEFESFYNYENTIDDPSPGFRIVLIFDTRKLVGLIHSRELQIENTKTHKLNWSYYVTFFDDFPEKGQLKFVDYMNEWIKGVD